MITFISKFVKLIFFGGKTSFSRLVDPNSRNIRLESSFIHFSFHSYSENIYSLFSDDDHRMKKKSWYFIISPSFLTF